MSNKNQKNDQEIKLTDEKTEGENVDYNPQETVDNNRDSLVKIEYNFFISHASRADFETKESIPPRVKEKEFVEELVEVLKKHDDQFTVYVDFLDNQHIDPSIFRHALKASKYGVFVCSPRFLDRWKNRKSHFIEEEVEHFLTVARKYHKPERIIPIIFGVDDLEYDSGPFSTSNYLIDAEYGSLSLSGMIEKVATKIINKVL